MLGNVDAKKVPYIIITRDGDEVQKFLNDNECLLEVKMDYRNSLIHTI
jgi:hypothetical protein